MAFTSTTTTTTRLVSRRLCANNGILGVTNTSIISPTTRRCLLSTHCQEAVGRFKGVLEEYRINNYQQEMPTRFKKEIIQGCSLLTIRTGTTTSTMTEEDPTNNVAVQELEQLLRNIGAFGDRVTHDDVALIVSEHSTPTTNTNTNTTTSSYNTEGPTQTIHADQILMQLL